MGLFLPQRWKSQPQVACELNPSHWLVERGVALYMPLGVQPGVVLGTIQLPSVDDIPREPDPLLPWGGLVANSTVVAKNIQFPFGVVSAYPFAIAAWGFRSDIATSRGIISIEQDSNNTHYLSWSGAAAGDPIRAVSVAAGVSSYGATTTGYSNDKYYHSVGVWASATSRTAYIDAGSSGTSTSSKAFGSPTVTKIGAGSGTTTFGKISNALILPWAPTDAEVERLYLEQKENPYEILKPLQRRIYSFPAAAVTFNPAWARGANVILKAA